MTEPMIAKRWFALFLLTFWLSSRLPFSLLFIAWAFIAALPFLVFLMLYLLMIAVLRAAERGLQRLRS